MSLFSEINAAAKSDPTGDPQALASRLYRKLGRAEIVSLLAREIAHAQRSSVRSAEVVAFIGAGAVETRNSGTTTLALGVNPAFAELFGKSFKLGDGSPKVLWEKATVEQHEQRIAMLEKIRDGIDRAVERHREAVSILRRTGAKCLAEVEDLAA